MLHSGDEKHVMKFLQPDKNAKKRLHHAVEYVRTTNHFNESKFINDHHATLFSLMIDAISQYDEERHASSMPSDQKKLFGVLSSNMKKAFAAKVSDEKFLLIIELLDRIVYHLPHKLAQRTFLESVQDILVIFLHPNNALLYRISAFEVLLRCVQHVAETVQTATPLTALLVSAIAVNAKPFETQFAQLINRTAIPNTTTPPIDFPEPRVVLSVSERDAAMSTTTEQSIMQFLEVIFRVSTHGLCKYEGSVTTRNTFQSPLDEINNFIFWRDFIFEHISQFILGAKIVDGAVELESAIEGCVPVRPHKSVPLPSARTLRFSMIPVGIQSTIEAWVLECLSSRVLADHFLGPESCYFVLVILEQRFHPEILRQITGVELCRRTLNVYRKLIMASDYGPSGAAKLSSNSSLTIPLYSETTPEIHPSYVIPKRPVHMTRNLNVYLLRFLLHVHSCFIRVDEHDMTSAMLAAQINSIHDCASLLRLYIEIKPEPVVSTLLREKVFDICRVYCTRSRGKRDGTIFATLNHVVELAFACYLGAPNWHEVELHSEFSIHLRQWLIERAVVRIEDHDFENGGLYHLYSKSGDNDLTPPSEFKVMLADLWGRLLFTAFNSCWLYIDYFRGIDLTAQPDYIHYSISCKEILDMVNQTTQQGPLEGPRSESGAGASSNLPLPMAHSQAGAAATNLWVSDQYISLFSIGSMYDAIVAVDRILRLVPLATLAVLSPRLHAIVISSISDVMLFAVRHVIVKQDHFAPTAPLPSNKVERTNLKMAVKMRAKVQEYERGSAVTATSPSTLLGLVLPLLVVAGMDVRALFENSKIFAIEAICAALNCKALRGLHPALQERCLAMIFQATLYSGHVRIRATCVVSCPSLFASGMPGASMLIDPMLTVIERLFQSVHWKKLDIYSESIISPSSLTHCGQYTSPIIQHMLQRNDDTKLPIGLVEGCLEMLYGICATIYRFPTATGVSGASSRSDEMDVKSNFRTHTMETVLRLTIESAQFGTMGSRVVDLLDRYIWMTPVPVLKHQFLHMLLLLFLFDTRIQGTFQKMHAEAATMTGPAESNLTPLRRRVLECLCAYLTGPDKAFVLIALEMLLSVTDLCEGSVAIEMGRMAIETIATITRNYAITIIQSAIENLYPLSHLPTPDRAASVGESPVPPMPPGPPSMINTSTCPGADSGVGNSYSSSSGGGGFIPPARRGDVMGSCGGGGTSKNLSDCALDRPRLSSAGNASDSSDLPQSKDLLASIVKAGLKCITRWAIRHPQLLDIPETRTMFFDCFDSCSVGHFISQLDVVKRARLAMKPTSTGGDPSSGIGMSSGSRFRCLSGEDEKRLKAIPNELLPKLLHADFGAFDIREVVAVTLTGSDDEMQTISQEADMCMQHLLAYYRQFPCCSSGPSVIDSVRATDTYGLSRVELNDVMGVETRDPDDEQHKDGVVYVHGVSKHARQRLTATDKQHDLSGDTTCDADEEKCTVSVEATDSHQPIHISYKNRMIFTLVDSVDGVARIICRDMLGAHVWVAVPLDELPPNPTSEAVLNHRHEQQQRAPLVRNLVAAEAEPSKDTKFEEVNPLRMPRTRPADTSTRSPSPASQPTAISLSYTGVNPLSSPRGAVSHRRLSLAALVSATKQETLTTASTDHIPTMITEATSAADGNGVSGSSACQTETIVSVNMSTTLSSSELHEQQQISDETAHSTIIDNTCDARGNLTVDESCKRVGDCCDTKRIDLGRDYFADMLSELPLDQLEDCTLLKGYCEDTCVGDDVDSSTLNLTDSSESYAALHVWVLKMLTDGFLWRRFIEFLRTEFCEEGACFMEDVFALQKMAKVAQRQYGATAQLHQQQDALLALQAHAEHIFDTYLAKGADQEINISDKACRIVTEMLTSSPSGEPPAGVEHARTGRDFAFYENVFQIAFDDVSSMLVRDKLTRFFKTIENRWSVLTDLETINRDIARCISVTEDALTKTPPLAHCEPPPLAQAVTLKDSVRIFVSQLGLLPSATVAFKEALSNSVEGDRSPLRSHACMEDFKILYGSNSTSFSDGKKVPPKSSKQIIQELRHIDTLPVREQFKIAVLYVRSGQYKQRDILANTCGSALYNDFLDTLGPTVDLATHQGFDGRLDAVRFTSGRYFPYFADDHVEVFYHVATRMPTDPDDEQLISKKKHIGNDFVHVVWTEDSREYSPLTITSDFGDVVICIHPLQGEHCSLRGHCQIRLYVKGGLDRHIGPLMHGMVLPFSMVGPLVRLTAIRANRAVNIQHRKTYDCPDVVRQNAIAKTIESCGMPFSYEVLLNLLYPSPTSSSSSGRNGKGKPTTTSQQLGDIEL